MGPPELAAEIMLAWRDQHDDFMLQWGNTAD